MKLWVSKGVNNGKNFFNIYFFKNTDIKESLDSVVLEYPFKESKEISSVIVSIMNLQHPFSDNHNELAKELTLVLSKIFEAGYNLGEKNAKQSLAIKLELQV